ncbi:uncharacterized protein LOC131572572 [Poecile atricapillus]|uniref:uncharacterized protein LOC131572572 n=1 Tax=Poecile atricapillus TaxID=48891 RepID=UPI002738F1CF|nr:uncharacterized protein LOC131572572 [Poecile atricapillus]
MFQAGAPSLRARRSPPWPPPPPSRRRPHPTPPRLATCTRDAAPLPATAARPGPRCPPLPTGQRLRSPPTARRRRRLAGRSRCAAPAALRSAPLAACAGARLGAVAVTPHAQPRSGAAGAEGGAGAGRADPARAPRAGARLPRPGPARWRRGPGSGATPALCPSSCALQVRAAARRMLRSGEGCSRDAACCGCYVDRYAFGCEESIVGLAHTKQGSQCLQIITALAFLLLSS